MSNASSNIEDPKGASDRGRTSVPPAVTVAAQPGRTAATAAPKPVENDREAALLMLLAVEAEARGAASEADLIALICNEMPKICRARQVFLLGAGVSGLEIRGVTAMASVDRGAPLLQLLERTVERLSADVGLDDVKEFGVGAYGGPEDSVLRSYPLREALWAPFKNRSGTVNGGVLLTREIAWTERDALVARRLADTFGHAFVTLHAEKKVLGRYLPGKKVCALGACLLAALAFVPVTLTTLAPVEVAASKPFVVAAGLDGAIEDIPVEPNAFVKTGQTLVRFTDTELKNRLEVAEREVMVAEARLKTTTQIAFADPRGKHELAVARADLALKSAERDYARDLLARAQIKAEKDGLAVFSNKNELIGKPVTIGERLLQIADPKAVEFQIDVPVADAIIVSEGARVKIFLDSSPFKSLEAALVRSDFLAKANDGVTLSFRVTASASEALDPVPRIGARGTAQIYGDRVPLGFYLLRRPFTALRQWTGL